MNTLKMIRKLLHFVDKISQIFILSPRMTISDIMYSVIQAGVFFLMAFVNEREDLVLFMDFFAHIDTPLTLSYSFMYAPLFRQLLLIIRDIRTYFNPSYRVIGIFVFLSSNNQGF